MPKRKVRCGALAYPELDSQSFVRLYRVYRGYIYIYIYGLYWGYIGTMEKKMETIGIIGVIDGLVFMAVHTRNSLVGESNSVTTQGLQCSSFFGVCCGFGVRDYTPPN